MSGAAEGAREGRSSAGSGSAPAAPLPARAAGGAIASREKLLSGLLSDLPARLDHRHGNFPPQHLGKRVTLIFVPS